MTCNVEMSIWQQPMTRAIVAAVSTPSIVGVVSMNNCGRKLKTVYIKKTVKELQQLTYIDVLQIKVTHKFYPPDSGE